MTLDQAAGRAFRALCPVETANLASAAFPPVEGARNESFGVTLDPSRGARF